MTLKEFRRAFKQDDRFLINVIDHKTFHVHGPAKVVLTNNLHNWMTIFVQEVRSKVPGVGVEENQPVFPSFNGTKMESNQINKGIKSVWKKAGLEGRIHSTLLRIGAVSACHRNHKDMARNPAELMAHKEDTAAKYYRLSEKGKASVKASQALHEIMRKRSFTPCTETSMDEQEQPNEDMQEKKDIEQDAEELVKTGDKNQSKSPWSSKAVQEMRKLFEEEILQHKVSMDCVKERIKNIHILQGEDARRVYDRIQAEWGYSTSQNDATADFPTENEELSEKVDRLFSEDKAAGSDIVPPATLGHSTKVVFSEGQVRTTLHRLFQDMYQNAPVSRKVISDRLSCDAEGKDILEKLLLPQIVNRIKYERRQRRDKQAFS